jgi:hypothetical protein
MSTTSRRSLRRFQSGLTAQNLHYQTPLDHYSNEHVKRTKRPFIILTYFSMFIKFHLYMNFDRLSSHKGTINAECYHE